VTEKINPGAMRGCPYFSAIRRQTFFISFTLFGSLLSPKDVTCAALQLQLEHIVGGRTPYDENVMVAFVTLCIYQ